jgi:carbonic anhydrase
VKSPWRRFFAADVPNSSLTPQQALRRLLQGNQRFAAGKSRARNSARLRASLAAGQSPMAAILCCADSRVTPEIIFDQPLGQIFSVRVAGNFLHDDGLASLEYAALKLSTPLLFVLGHTDCGAVRAAMQAVQEEAYFPGHLPTLLRSLLPAVRQAIHAPPPVIPDSADPDSSTPEALLKIQLNLCTRLNVAIVMRNLADAQPVIAPMAESARVLIAGGVYNVSTGHIDLIDPAP